jgi:hypothetical protein
MRRISLIAAALTLTVGIALAIPALAKTIEVPKDYQTIQAAINAAQPGDLILIAPGIYKENLTIRKSIELRGADAGVIVDGSRARNTPTILIQRTRDVVIQNLRDHRRAPRHPSRAQPRRHHQKQSHSEEPPPRDSRHRQLPGHADHRK